MVDQVRLRMFRTPLLPPMHPVPLSVDQVMQRGQSALRDPTLAQDLPLLAGAGSVFLTASGAPVFANVIVRPRTLGSRLVKARARVKGPADPSSARERVAKVTGHGSTVEDVTQEEDTAAVVNGDGRRAHSLKTQDSFQQFSVRNFGCDVPLATATAAISPATVHCSAA